ncbi:hypothetical protein [Cryptosporangium arvum]|uniref:hypothetical protein n=1 Tax=Cryptosporangium arvum TaxID=80871 RepID=UPI0004BC02D3|nr:hypothetical protein [Cryptosporangium arvum]
MGIRFTPTSRLSEGFCPDVTHGRLRLESVGDERAGRCDGCDAWWRPEFRDGELVAAWLLTARADGDVTSVRADSGSLDRGLPVSDYVAYAHRR